MSESIGKVKSIVDKIGLPTIIIALFWVFVLCVGKSVGIPLQTQLSDTIRRAGMNGILVLAMVPAIQSGTGPNFALPVGIIAGLFSAVLAIEAGAIGVLWLITAVAIAIPMASLFGLGYGKLMNAVKGSEMTIATYTGFSICAGFCLVWLMVPFKNPKMGWFIGEGLRETIQLDSVKAEQILNNFLSFKIGSIFIPTGLLLTFFFFAFMVWLFFKSKIGIAISAAGASPKFAVAAGLNINRNRVIANILSTVLAAIGIIVYSQSYGFTQLYLGPLMMAFTAVAAVLIGGATAKKAKVSHVIIGVFLYQGLLTTALPVANQIFAGTDLSETMRMVIQNGVILYALTQVKGGGR